ILYNRGNSCSLLGVCVMFDGGAWRIRSIWDGVKLEVGESSGPVVLNSFTQLDPDLPLLEVPD
uniref:Uncharacterized protein n=1 Tax=Astyanax mexicanus TaxID=7994 RepID=A0A3B1K5R7_ASTMX